MGNLELPLPSWVSWIVCSVCDNDGKMLATMGNSCSLIVIPPVQFAFSLICMVISWVLNEFGFKKISWVLNKFLSLLLVFIYCIWSVLSDCSGAHLFINLLVHLRVCVDFGTDSLTLIQWRIKWKSVVTKKVKEKKKGQIALSPFMYQVISIFPFIY